MLLRISYIYNVISEVIMCKRLKLQAEPAGGVLRDAAHYSVLSNALSLICSVPRFCLSSPSPMQRQHKVISRNKSDVMLIQ